LTHIYPLNPTSDEIKLLENEERLSEDVNDERNIIPLCKNCHGKFDSPRTVDEYRQLLLIKKKLISNTLQEKFWSEYNLEEQISEVISALYRNPEVDIDVEIDFTPRALDEKLNDTMSNLTGRKIHHNVRDYYYQIKRQLGLLDQKYEDLSEAIACQVKAYYIKQKSLGSSQQEIFENIVLWLNVKTKPKTSEATEILASFYVQNCEVF